MEAKGPPCPDHAGGFLWLAAAVLQRMLQKGFYLCRAGLGLDRRPDPRAEPRAAQALRSANGPARKPIGNLEVVFFGSSEQALGSRQRRMQQAGQEGGRRRRVVSTQPPA